MLGRRGLKAATYLCSRCGLLNIAPNTSFKSPIRRQIHGTQSPLGILDFLIGDTFQARLHKEIGKMLEDYDQHLIICYKEAVEAYKKAYMSGARADLVAAFSYVVRLEKLSTRMETFINTNELLKQTRLREIFHKGEAQQKTDAFLQMMHAKYDNDAQFKYILSQMQPKEPSKPIEKEYTTTRIGGWTARMYNWIRGHEIERLREDFDNAKELAQTARSTGRRRDIRKAMEAAEKLEELLEERYQGRLWQQEIMVEKLDPRLKRTDENMAKLSQLQQDIKAFIVQIHKEFEAASGRESPSENEK